MEAVSDDWSHAENTQLLQSPLLVRDDHIIYRQTTELVFFDAKTLARTGAIPGAYKSAGLLPDGRLAAFSRVDGRCTLDISANHEASVSVRIAECLPSDGARMFASGADEVVISRGRDQLVRYRIEQDQLAKVETLALPASSGADQTVALDDGRLVVPAPGSLNVLGGGAPRTHSVSGAIAHLARGSGELLWFTTWKRGGGVEKLMLGRLRDKGVAVIAGHDVAPARIIHIASDKSGALAALTVTVDDRARTWHLHLFEPTGQRRWQVAIEDELATKLGLDLNAAFVAFTDDRVVLALERHGLFAWDTKTGAR